MESRRASLKDRHKIHHRHKIHRREQLVEHLKYGEPALLHLRRKIFLSHSGKDKNFVRFLYKELCKHYNCYEISFFDEETLPKAEPISMENNLKEARGSELGVLVLTEDFFVQTPNPMPELAEFVTYNMRLLPLFFTMSMDEVKEKSRRARWEKHWRKWSIVDERVMKVWTDALDRVTVFFGLEYCKIAIDHPDYIAKIVNKVIDIIPP